VGEPPQHRTNPIQRGIDRSVFGQRQPMRLRQPMRQRQPMRLPQRQRAAATEAVAVAAASNSSPLRPC
jgi:hypothetical protein